MPQKDSRMQIEIKATNLEMTDAIKSYLTDKLLSLEKVINVDEGAKVLAEVELGKNTEHHQSGENLFKAEINLTIDGKFFRVVSEKHDIYAAIDEMKDDINREVRKDKEKSVTMQRKGGRSLKDKLRSFWSK